VNEVATEVTDEPQQPQDQKYYQDCPQHYFHSPLLSLRRFTGSEMNSSLRRRLESEYLAAIPVTIDY
jgi:hypothetical protein